MAVDALAIVLALVIAALARVDSWAGLGATFVAAWLLLELASRSRRGRATLARTRSSRAVLPLLAVVSFSLWTSSTRLLEREGLLELGPRLADRLRLASDPAIAPPLVRTDRPQTFFVRAREGAHVRVRFGSLAREAEPLGHGVYRVDLDPFGADLGEPESSNLPVAIDVDGASEELALPWTSPLPRPRIGRASSDGGRVCVVSEETDEVRVGALGVLERRSVGDGPVGCAFVGEHLLVAHRYDSALLWLGAARASDRLDIGPGAVGIAASGRFALVARDADVDEVVVVDVTRRAVLGRAAIAGVPLAVAAIDETSAVLSTRSPASIVRIDLDADEVVLRVRPLAMPAAALAVSPDRRSVVLATTDFSDDAGENTGNHYVEDQLVWLDAESLEARRIEPTARRTARQDHAGDVDRGLSPAALAFDDDGALFVAFAGSHELGVFPPDRPARWADLASVAPVPDGVAVVGDRVVVTSRTYGVLVEIDRSSLETLRLERWAPDDATLLRSAPHRLRLRLGERSFWEGTRAGVACQSCHLDGATDGAAHNIGGRVLAPTLDVRGLAGTSPFLRDGSYPRLGDLHEVAVLEYRGYRAPAGDRRATLEAYLASLPIPFVFGARDPERERRGLDVFFRAGCARCHAPPAFTNLSRHLEVALFPDRTVARGEGAPSRSLDVPPLRNLRESAPYLVDGRARTLRDVLTTENRANRHGDTAALTSDELDDLLTFLESL